MSLELLPKRMGSNWEVIRLLPGNRKDLDGPPYPFWVWQGFGGNLTSVDQFGSD